MMAAAVVLIVNIIGAAVIITVLAIAEAQRARRMPR